MTAAQPRIVHPGIAFWLLACAWACASFAPHAAAPLGKWLQGAAHFSHDAALRKQVAGLLAEHAVALIPPKLTRSDAPVIPEAPVVPATPLLKKLSWPPLERIAPSGPSHRAPAWPVAADDIPGERRDDVPHPPPRSASRL